MTDYKTPITYREYLRRLKEGASYPGADGAAADEMKALEDEILRLWGLLQVAQDFGAKAATDAADYKQEAARLRAEVARYRAELGDVGQKLDDIQQASAKTMRIALDMLSGQIREALEGGEG